MTQIGQGVVHVPYVGEFIKGQWKPPITPLSRQAWVERGAYLRTVRRDSQWWVADWLLYGHERWGRSVAAMARAIGFNPRTVYQWMWVARSFPPERRFKKLSIYHHRAVMALSAKAAERLLAEAEFQGWSVRRLRAEVQRKTRSRRSQKSFEVKTDSRGRLVLRVKGTTHVLDPAEAEVLAEQLLSLAQRIQAAREAA